MALPRLHDEDVELTGAAQKNTVSNMTLNYVMQFDQTIYIPRDKSNAGFDWLEFKLSNGLVDGERHLPKLIVIAKQNVFSVQDQTNCQIIQWG